ncbi:MAG TPA: GntR family transcriptional regulator [Galbitalea sp.]
MIVLDDDDATPPFEQIRSQLANHIRAGTLEDGYRLPSVRQLAADLRVAAGTVARAYTALEADGLIESSRTGTRVRAGQSVTAAARAAARTFIGAIRAEQHSLNEALSAVRAEWAAAEEHDPTSA